MNRPSSRDAWIGCLGAIAGALVAGLLALVPWWYSQPDPTVELRRTIEAGLRGLSEIENPDQKLRQIDELERLLALDQAFHFEKVLEDNRDAILKEQRSIAEAKKEEEAERRRLAKLVAAQQEAADQAQKSRLAAEAEAARQAAAAAEAQRKAEAQAAKSAAENAQRAAEAAEAARRSAIEAAQRELQSDRVCRDPLCTSWILP